MADRSVAELGGPTGPGGWYGQKVLWRVSRSYRGPLLVRGRQLDGAGTMTFDSPGGRAYLKMDTRRGLDYATTTYTGSLGCYAWEIDGPHVSQVIVFKAVWLADSTVPHAAVDPQLWVKLMRRQLRIPRLPSGAECPMDRQSAGSAHHLFGIPKHPGPVPGPGPAYPQDYVQVSAQHGLGFVGVEVWNVDNTFKGPILVRARQVDGHGQVVFQKSVPGAHQSSLRLYPPQPGHPRLAVYSAVRVPSPGCYAFQIDAPQFSRVIFFKAGTSAS
ncbi:MAG: hypothetical protein ACR2KG_07415 [Nocardioidaceae bacterium]